MITSILESSFCFHAAVTQQDMVAKGTVGTEGRKLDDLVAALAGLLDRL